MELGLVAAGSIAKLFIAVLIGALAAALKFIDENGTKAIAGLVNNVTNPLKLLSSYMMVYSAVKFKGLVVSAGLMTLATLISIAAAAIFIRKKGEYWRVERVATVLSNCGFMGIPLISALFGNEAVFYLTGCLMVFNIAAWTYGITVISGRSSFADLVKVLFSPIILSIVAGLCIYLLRIPVPDLVRSGIEAVGDCTSPLAMLVAGSSIARTKLGKTLTRPSIWLTVFLRLLLCPIIFALICSFLSLPDLVFKTVLVAAACPVAAITVTQAISENRTPGHASALFAISTLLSMVSIPVVLMAQEFIAGLF